MKLKMQYLDIIYSTQKMNYIKATKHLILNKIQNVLVYLEDIQRLYIIHQIIYQKLKSIISKYFIKIINLIYIKLIFIFIRCIDIMLDKVKPLADNVLAKIMEKNYPNWFNKRIEVQYPSKVSNINLYFIYFKYNILLK
jgi:hypothetical protein